MEDIKQEEAKKFAVRILKLGKYLNDKREFIISNQIVRSGASIGANLAESEFAASKNDFISKISIALKEANETKYWLELLFETEQITKEESESLKKDCLELISILVKVLNSSKSN